MELFKTILEGVGLLAQVLGFLSLYAIAIALLDWRKTERYKQHNMRQEK
jgi:hypothetical protein